MLVVLSGFEAYHKFRGAINVNGIFRTGFSIQSCPTVSVDEYITCALHPPPIVIDMEM